MIEMRSLTKLNLADLKRVASGYSSDSKYAVVHTETESCVSFDLRLVTLDKPYIKKFHYDDEILRQYNTVLTPGTRLGHTMAKCLWDLSLLKDTDGIAVYQFMSFMLQRHIAIRASVNG